MPGRILIVDHDAGFSALLDQVVRQAGHDTVQVATLELAQAHLESAGADVVVVDDRMPGGEELSFLDVLRPLAAGAVFLVVSDAPNLEVAVDAMRRGAFDYISKQVEDRELAIRIERAAEVALLRRRMAEANVAGGGLSKPVETELLGDSAAMKALRERLHALSESDDTTVLIVGETGTGKGVVARTIHAQSRRAFEPFVAVDCTTIPATLVESELFGFERGAFSGADRPKTGRVEAAGRGTLFLDEIGELELPMQSKLLRLLEEREFTRVGGTKPRRLEARIITATNRRLDRAVREGKFRADLRYRLAVFILELPPLSERGDDILALARHFAQERARVLGRPTLSLHPELADALPKYPFPGNVRELRNMVEQAVLLAKGDELVLEDFPVLERASFALIRAYVLETGLELPERSPAPRFSGRAPAQHKIHALYAGRVPLGGPPQRRRRCSPTTKNERSRAVHARRAVSMDAVYGDAEPLSMRLRDSMIPSAEHCAEASTQHDLLVGALKKIPARQREAIELSVFEGMALREIGRRMGITESRVCQLQKRAVEHLKKVVLEESSLSAA
jgi:RNA polymerase sigma factor (sigma-70 family)